MKKNKLSKHNPSKHLQAKRTLKKNSVFFTSSTPDPIKSTVESAIISSGRSLPSETKNFFEPKFNYSFDHVKIHTGETASRSADKLNANAFTYKNHIVFNEGKFKPETTEGKKLIAHELAHVNHHSHKNVIARKPKQDPPPKPSAEEIKRSKEQREAAVLFWTDLKTGFPGAGRKLAGSYHDDAIDYLNTNFTEGEVMEAGVKTVYSAPRIAIGIKYLAENDASKRQGYIKAELDKIDLWRFDQARIDNDDLSNTLITGKLDALDVFALGDYIQKLAEKKFIANDKLREYIRKKMPSTPAFAGATATAAGGFELQFGNIKVIVMPDVFDDASVAANSAETNLEPVNHPSYTIQPAYEWKADKITKIAPHPNVPDVIYKVETHYGPGADPAGKSGYGAGTAAGDIAAGNTTLRFHEGSHGTIFIQEIKNNYAANSYPVFTAKVGDKKEAFEKYLSDYAAKVNAFRQMLTNAIDASTQKVDCVGKTIEQFHKEKGTVSTVKCKP